MRSGCGSAEKEQEKNGKHKFVMDSKQKKINKKKIRRFVCLCGDQNIPKFYVYVALCTSSHREEWNMQCMETTYHSPTYPTHTHIHPHTHSHEGKLICDGPTKIKGRLIFFILFSGAADEARIEYPPPSLSTAQQLFSDLSSFRFLLSFHLLPLLEL